MALFHVAGRDFHELQHLLELREIGVGFVRAAHVGFADDFDQRRAAAVEVHVGITVGVLEAVVDALARVVFHVDARHADALRDAVHHDIDAAVLPQRLVVLRNLVALGQVRIEVVLARKARFRANPAVQRQRPFDRQFHRLAAQHRQRARQPQADRADVGVGRRAEARGASAKNLRRGAELHVHFEPDDRFVARNYFGSRHSNSGRGHGVFPL